MNDSEDQVQESENTETSESTDSEETNETQGTEQSDENKGESKETGSKLYKTPDGRELSADQMYEEYGKLYPEFTRRSQKLREYEKAEEEAKSRVEQETRKTVDQSDLLKDVDPSVKEAIVKIVEPVIQQAIGGLKEEATQQERDKAFTTELDSLERKYPGGDGRPKFERSKVIAKMREPDNRDYNPETVYEKMYHKELFDYELKQALKKQKGGSQLETTGADESGKPQGKTPKNWDEAGKSAISRF